MKKVHGPSVSCVKKTSYIECIQAIAVSQHHMLGEIRLNGREKDGVKYTMCFHLIPLLFFLGRGKLTPVQLELPSLKGHNTILKAEINILKQGEHVLGSQSKLTIFGKNDTDEVILDKYVTLEKVKVALKGKPLTLREISLAGQSHHVILVGEGLPRH